MKDHQYTELVKAMTEWDKGSPKRIQHFLKVHAFAKTIGVQEGLDEETLYILETAALVHDIGIRPALEKYGSEAGPYQEAEGPAEAEKLLRRVGGYTEAQIERICRLVGHHHTYTGIDGMDYRILVEADFLVNLYESSVKYKGILAAEKNIFETETGRYFLHAMFEDLQ
ncbi:MAG: HD domain-containing protein [Solobacterium sp.]|nr:HD domain-containing protein [Solobacterium sp.]